MPINFRSVMTGPETGVYVSMSLYLQAADVHRTLGNGGSDISGQSLPRNQNYALLLSDTNPVPADDRLLSMLSGNCKAIPFSEASSALSEAFLPLISDLKASPSDAHSRGRPHFALSSAMEALPTSENGSPAEGVQSQQQTKSSKQRFKPQLSCTFLPKPKVGFLIHLKSLLWAGPCWSS